MCLIAKAVSRYATQSAEFLLSLEPHLSKHLKASKKETQRAEQTLSYQTCQKVAAIFVLLQSLGNSHLTAEGAALLAACAVVMATSMTASPVHQVCICMSKHSDWHQACAFAL